MRDIDTKILTKKKISENFYEMTFAADWKGVQPGQFVMVSIPQGDVFLRRPFGIMDLEDGVARICFKVVGKGTYALSQAQVDSKIKVLGPCGKGFDINNNAETFILVAGGYGVVPLVGFAKEVIKQKKKVVFYYGAKNSDGLIFKDELLKIGTDLKLSTEDGSLGEKGFVTERLVNEIDTIKTKAMFACGPKGLLKEVAKIGRDRNIFTQISLEEHMACGIGVCLGCVCKDAQGDFVRVCSEGPVFDIKAVNSEW